MQHVNMRYTHLGLLHLLWAMLSGGFLILICFALYGTIFTNDFELLLAKIRTTPFQWPVGIFQLLAVVGLIVGLIIIAQRAKKSSAKGAATAWIIIGALALGALFFIPVFNNGITVIKEGVFHHALLISALEPYLLIALMLILLVVMLIAVYRKSFSGIAVTLFTGTLVWTLSFAVYSGLAYLGLGILSFGGPVLIFIIVLLFYFFRPIGTRKASMSKDLKRLKTLRDQVKKTYPKMDFSLINEKYKAAEKGSTIGAISGVAYERNMRQMDEAFETIYSEVKKHYESLDNNTRPMVEAFGHVRSLKKNDVKITELEGKITELETLLSKGEMEKAKQLAMELKTKARGLKDVFESSKSIVSQAEEAVSRLRNLGADDPEAVKGYEKATNAFAAGKYEDASLAARLARDEGNATADIFERLMNLMNNIENRINNKENYRLYTGDIEEELLMVKDKLREAVK